MFDDMLRWMRDSGGVFENDNPQGLGRPAVPLNLKMMAALRFPAIGCHVGPAAGMYGIGHTTIQEFFPVCVDWFLKEYYDAAWVRPPDTPMELHAMETIFNRSGLLGCVASMDGVHVELGCAPTRDKHLYVGEK
uniref:DDE Tnp4 domain-containing protein n=1 Tax=Tetraselmis chuii TaxID=63592 RepID=A0A7S1SLD7_9CHLO|mmetsp:Transcript_18307/g.32575  ORF Transcript_18307/g.32575 Transcript_18307/m.32575 type:complete len:134 (+) Transcript_18307:547-948(+)